MRRPNGIDVGGIRDMRMFLLRMLRAPRRTGAIAPSSRYLARAMAAQVEVHRSGWVIELGGGSGVVTRALLQHGIKPERLLVLELDRRLCKMLREHFPGVRVVHGDAAKLPDILQEHHVHHVNAVVSSLPLLSFPKKLATTVIHHMAAALPEEGKLVQFTYGPVSPIPGKLMKRNNIHGRRVRKVWLNLPPATIWCYARP